MSREVGGSGETAAATQNSGTGTPGARSRRPVRRTFGSRRVTRAALVGLVALSAVAVVEGRHGRAEPALSAQLVAEPGARLDQAADLDRLNLALVLNNPGHTARPVDDVEVNGLGQVFDAVVPGTLRVAAGGSVRIPIAVAADCTLVGQDRPSVTVDGARLVVRGGDPRVLLAPMCPPSVPGLVVDVVAARADGADGLAVRLVNHGGVTATVVALGSPATRAPKLVAAPAPALPLTLVPQAAATVRLRAGLTGCPGPTDPDAAAGALSLEARMPEGYAEVGHWPADLVRAAVETAVRRCSTG
jgi:hypothetical protein